ncbi:hypothetical protein G7064_21710 (plasmid) [Hymenobacter sp. HDW8]|nr:hypothetical protein [Hymenobacter sp. HDW8]QIL78440.1 hypothetical protein G7064_21710 [Hymenobacter sp. HDW8]
MGRKRRWASEERGDGYGRPALLQQHALPRAALPLVRAQPVHARRQARQLQGRARALAGGRQAPRPDWPSQHVRKRERGSRARPRPGKRQRLPRRARIGMHTPAPALPRRTGARGRHQPGRDRGRGGQPAGGRGDDRVRVPGLARSYPVGRRRGPHQPLPAFIPLVAQRRARGQERARRPFQPGRHGGGGRGRARLDRHLHGGRGHRPAGVGDGDRIGAAAAHAQALTRGPRAPAVGDQAARTWARQPGPQGAQAHAAPHAEGRGPLGLDAGRGRGGEPKGKATDVLALPARARHAGPHDVLALLAGPHVGDVDGAGGGRKAVGARPAVAHGQLQLARGQPRLGAQGLARAGRVGVDEHPLQVGAAHAGDGVVAGLARVEGRAGVAGPVGLPLRPGADAQAGRTQRVEGGGGQKAHVAVGAGRIDRGGGQREPLVGLELLVLVVVDPDRDRGRGRGRDQDGVPAARAQLLGRARAAGGHQGVARGGRGGAGRGLEQVGLDRVEVAGLDG